MPVRPTITPISPPALRPHAGPPTLPMLTPTAPRLLSAVAKRPTGSKTVGPVALTFTSADHAVRYNIYRRVAQAPDLAVSEQWRPAAQLEFEPLRYGPARPTFTLVDASTGTATTPPRAKSQYTLVGTMGLCAPDKAPDGSLVFVDDGASLAASTKYCYVVSATALMGREGPLSNELSATTISPGARPITRSYGFRYTADN